jgi:hypothetical protein
LRQNSGASALRYLKKMIGKSRLAKRKLNVRFTLKSKMKGRGDLILFVHPHPDPPPSRGCVVMMEEGRFRRNRQSGSSALECGRLKLWLIGLLRNGIVFMGLELRS